MEKFQEAMHERKELDRRRSGRGHGDDQRDRRGRHDNRPQMMFSDSASSSRGSFKRPHEKQQQSADVDEFGRERRAKRSLSPSPDEKEVKAKLTKIMPSTTPLAPSRPVIISQHSNPHMFSEKPPLTTDELNRLNAKVMKAKLMGADNVAELEKEYEVEKKKADEYGTVCVIYFFKILLSTCGNVVNTYCSSSFRRKIHQYPLCQPLIAKASFMNLLYPARLSCLYPTDRESEKKSLKEPMIARLGSGSSMGPMMIKLAWTI